MKEHRAFLLRLEQLLADAPPTEELAQHGEQVRRNFRTRLAKSLALLADYDSQFDQIERPTEVFHPGRPQNIARLIAQSLEEQQERRLDELAPFYGSGIYCLYYRGDHPAYNLISGSKIPIYVGKASPKDPNAVTAVEQSTALYKRLSEHRKSIEEVEAHPKKTLSLHDFYCKVLVVETGWESAAEAHLIRTYAPIWNKESNVCRGLGKHGDFHDTRRNAKSDWDALHPGRRWATRRGNRRSRRNPAEIIQNVRKHCLIMYSTKYLKRGNLRKSEIRFLSAKKAGKR